MKIDYFGMDLPSAQWGGLIDLGAIDPKNGLLLIYREKSGLGLQSSCVSFGDKVYFPEVDEAVSQRPYFVAYKAYLTTGVGYDAFPDRIAGTEIQRLCGFKDSQ